MRIHYLSHVPFEQLGAMEAWFRERDATISQSLLFQGDPLPDTAEFDVLVVMGGPMSVNDEAELTWLAAEKAFIRQALTADKRVLGVCLGAQLIASALGQRVYPGAEKEIGWLPIYGNTHLNGAAFHFPDQIDVLHWHGETFDLPAGAVLLASSEVCRHQAFQLGRSVIGLQFHLEANRALLDAFVTADAASLVPAGQVQSAEQILAVPQDTLDATAALLERLLDYLLEEQP